MPDPFQFQDTFAGAIPGVSWSLVPGANASCQLRIVNLNTMQPTDCPATVAPSSTSWLQMEMTKNGSPYTPSCTWQVSIDKQVEMKAPYLITFWEMIKFDGVDGGAIKYNAKGFVDLISSGGVNDMSPLEMKTPFADSSWEQPKISASIAPDATKINALEFTLQVDDDAPVGSTVIGCIDDITVAPQN
jgi:hypothetical protein